METQNQERYTVKAGGFEGPFGLLLDLVEKRKLFINDVSLAAVTEDFIKYMNEGNFSPREVSSFVLVASTLLLIKSKSLLPNMALTSEEEGDIKSLEERLRLYELFTRLGAQVKSTFGKKIIFPPLPRKMDVLIFLPDSQITKERMMTLARDVLGAMPKKVFLPEVEVKKVISMEEMIDTLSQRIQTSLKMSFRDMFGKKEKIETIVGFLAMLELVRQGILDVTQESDRHDIIIKKNDE